MPIATAVSSSNQIFVPSTPDGVQHGVSAAAMLEGFFAKTPVAQPTAGGVVAGGAAGAGAAILRDSTVTGGVGSAAYTIGDIVAALKSLGLIAS